MLLAPKKPGCFAVGGLLSGGGGGIGCFVGAGVVGGGGSWSSVGAGRVGDGGGGGTAVGVVGGGSGVDRD